MGALYTRQQQKVNNAINCFAIGTFMLVAIRIMLLGRVIGNIGNGYFGLPYVIFQLGVIICGYSLSGMVNKLVRRRVNKGQIRNAIRVFRAAFGICLFVGGIVSLIAFASADSLVAKIFHASGCGDVLRLLAPAILVFGLVGCVKGLLNGFDIIAGPAIAGIVSEIVIGVVSVLASKYYMSYGTKVGKLIQNSAIKYSYGAKGAAVGILVGAVLCFVMMVVLYFMNHGRIRALLRKDNTTRDENLGHTYNGLIRFTYPLVGILLLVMLVPVFGLRASVTYYTNSVSFAYAMQCIGIFLAQMLIPVLIPIFIILQVSVDMNPLLHNYVKNDDKRSIRDVLANKIRYVYLFTIGCAACLFVIAKPFVQLVFGSNASDLAIYMLGFGVLLIAIYTFIIPMARVLIAMHQKKFVFLTALVADVVSIPVTKMTSDKIGVEGILIGLLVFAVILFAGLFVFVRRAADYKQEMIFSICIPTIAAVGAGLITFIVGLVLGKLHISAISVIGDLIVFYIVYWIIIALFKGITDEELYDIPTGKVVLAVLSRMNLIEITDYEEEE